MASSSPFDDGKEPGALRTIGEVAKALRLRQHVLRYWEQHFPMLKPLKRSGGRRLYRPEDVSMVQTIDRMVNHEGYTLRGARLALEKASATPTADPQQPALAERHESGPLFAQQASAIPDDVLPRLRAIRAKLAAALEA